MEVRILSQRVPRDGYIHRRSHRRDREERRADCNDNLRRPHPGARRQGRELQTEIINFDIIDTPDNMQDTFILDKVYKIKRRRIVNNECIAVETVYIPVDYCGHINEEMLKGSLYKILEDFGYSINNSISSIVAVAITDDIKKNFNTEENFPVLKIVGKTFANKNKLLFIEEALYRSDKFTLQVNISRREGEIL